ncbi:hypothetical protein D3C86_1563290 [compost metagenome]
MVRRGLNERYGSWNTIWMRLHHCRQAARDRRDTSSPFITMRPDVGRAKCARQRPSVVLPEPDSPTMPSVSPRAKDSDTPSSASTSRRLALNRLDVTKRMPRFSTLMTGSPSASGAPAPNCPLGTASISLRV